MKPFRAAILLVLSAVSVAIPKPQDLAPNAPADKPVAVNKNETQKFEDAIGPYVNKAKLTLPYAKKRYQKGLTKGEVFFITMKLYDPDRHYETVFVRVRSWEGDKIKGVLSSDLVLLKKHKNGEEVACLERDVLDWTISKPDGTEEGNFAGKFLDTYKP